MEFEILHVYILPLFSTTDLLPQIHQSHRISNSFKFNFTWCIFPFFPCSWSSPMNTPKPWGQDFHSNEIHKLHAVFSIVFSPQLIFSGEYTKAMEQDFHTGHFSCWNCDLSLTGHRYILREEHPFCIKCYENLFANACEECKKPIGTDSKVRDFYIRWVAAWADNILYFAYRGWSIIKWGRTLLR